MLCLTQVKITLNETIWLVSSADTMCRDSIARGQETSALGAESADPVLSLLDPNQTKI